MTCILNLHDRPIHKKIEMQPDKEETLQKKKTFWTVGQFYHVTVGQSLFYWRLENRWKGKKWPRKTTYQRKFENSRQWSLKKKLSAWSSMHKQWKTFRQRTLTEPRAANWVQWWVILIRASGDCHIEGKITLLNFAFADAAFVWSCQVIHNRLFLFPFLYCWELRILTFQTKVTSCLSV